MDVGGQLTIISWTYEITTWESKVNTILENTPIEPELD